MFRWAPTVLVPADRHYTQVSSELADYAPWFDRCIGAIDGTHIPVEVNQEAKVDFINRAREVSINVSAIVDMHGRFTYMWEPGRRVHVMTWRFYKIVKRTKGSRIHPQVCAYWSSF